MCEPGFKVEVYDRNYGIILSEEDCNILMNEIGEEEYEKLYLHDWRIRITQIIGGIRFEGEPDYDEGDFLDFPLCYKDSLIQCIESASNNKKFKHNISYKNPSFETDMKAYNKVLKSENI